MTAGGAHLITVEQDSLCIYSHSKDSIKFLGSKKIPSDREVHSMAYAGREGLFILNYWNEGTIRFLDLADSAYPEVLEVDMAEYAPFETFQITQAICITFEQDHYLLVGLANGHVLCFNLYLGLI